MTARAGLRQRRVDDLLGLREGDEGRPHIGGKGEVAIARAAGDLHVDEAFGYAVARDQLAFDLHDLLSRERRRDFDCRQRAVEAIEMRVVVDELAVEHRADLVDAVGEQEAAIEHGDLRLGARDVVAIDVDLLAQPRSPFRALDIASFRARRSRGNAHKRT